MVESLNSWNTGTEEKILEEQLEILQENTHENISENFGNLCRSSMSNIYKIKFLKISFTESTEHFLVELHDKLLDDLFKKYLINVQLTLRTFGKKNSGKNVNETLDYPL